jgi:hypothetical protein
VRFDLRTENRTAALWWALGVAPPGALLVVGDEAQREAAERAKVRAARPDVRVVVECVEGREGRR